MNKDPKPLGWGFGFVTLRYLRQHRWFPDHWGWESLHFHFLHHFLRFFAVIILPWGERRNCIVWDRLNLQAAGCHCHVSVSVTEVAASAFNVYLTWYYTQAGICTKAMDVLIFTWNFSGEELKVKDSKRGLRVEPFIVHFQDLWQHHTSSWFESVEGTTKASIITFWKHFELKLCMVQKKSSKRNQPTPPTQRRTEVSSSR